MSKLLQRLRDAKRSGVYRAGDGRAILDVTSGSGLDVISIAASERPLEKIARAAEFPAWFGGNWDALEDSLADLSWRKDEGRVLVFTSYPEGEERGILIDVLRSSAAYWTARKKPFFAIFIDPARSLPLPDLYREA